MAVRRALRASARPGAWAFAAALGFACGGPQAGNTTPASASAPPPAAATTATPTPSSTPPPPPPPAAPAIARPTWIVAGPKGVHEITLDGAIARTFTTIAARSPRWLPGRKAVVYLEASTHVLHHLELASGRDRVLAHLPTAAPCLPEAYKAAGETPPVQSLTNESELWVTEDGRTVCTVLADHAADLREVESSIAVPVAGGDLVHRVRGGTEICGRDDEDPPAACAELPASRHGGLPGGDEPPVDDPTTHSTSPDGRWRLVTVAEQLGDVLHHQVVLREVATRSFYSVERTGKRAWPAPVRLDASTFGESTFVDGLGEVEGSEAIVWIGPHHLVLGRTLFIAGEAIVELPGDPAL